jgi:GNAT superfamily N-acetyltransferase
LIGFVEYHHRRDEQTTLYHIVVIPARRRQGVGRALIDALRNEALALRKQIIRLKCPADLPAQGFYARLGLDSLGEESGNSRPLVVWALSLILPGTA